MQIAEIAQMIADPEKIPIFYSEKKTFSSVTYHKKESEKPRGIYLPNCDSVEAFEHCKLYMPDGFKRIKELISTKCSFDAISFSVFSILHEMGHLLQYMEFINKGHNDDEFIIHYELCRAYLISQKNVEFRTCKSKEDVVELNKKYDKLYAELPTEKYANDFARGKR